MANAYFATGGLEVRTGAIYTYTGIGKYGGGEIQLLGSIDMNSYGIGSPRVSATEIGYLDGVTSNIQTQINSLGSNLSIVWDTSPQLGGNLDVNGKYLATSSGDIDIRLGSTSGSTAFNIRNSDGTVICQIADDGTLTGPSAGSDLTFTQGVDINIMGTVGSYDVDFRDSSDALFFKINSNGQVTLYDRINMNEQSALYDVALASDHTYSASKMISATVDTNAFGLFACLRMASDGHFDTTDADAVASMPCEGMALETSTGTKLVMLDGFARDDSAFTATVGSLWYPDTATAGGMTTVAPSGSADVVQAVAMQYPNNVIHFSPGRWTTVVVA